MLKTLSRRRFLAAAAGVIAGGGVASPGLASLAERETSIPLGTQPAGLPPRQFAWVETLAKDAHGNAISPRFDRLLLFDLLGPPTSNDVRLLEASLRTLELTYPWGPGGLLFTVGWGPHYFEHALGVPTPIEHAKGLSEFELPTFDNYDLCIHLACDNEQRLADVELALVHGRSLAGAGSVDLSSILRWRETRTGFVGTGLPAAHQHANGIPPGNPVPATSPLFMGFKSGFAKNQASEDDVTITDGAFVNGTTMQMSYMRLRLDSWYQLLDEKERVARMYAPEVTPAQVDGFTDDAPKRSRQIRPGRQSLRRRRALPDISPRPAEWKAAIIRRDFNTVDGGLAGLHFVSIQKTIADFVTTRKAMNAANASYINPAITDTINNGINEFIFVLKRANYILPTRAARSYPLYPGQAAALEHP